MKKDINLKEEDISFECVKCGCKNFFLNTYYLNGYGELACPMCFSHHLKVIFEKYRRE